jgi:radical SAM superfamily enzyme YgiQ (UPF0313 family)
MALKVLLIDANNKWMSKKADTYEQVVLPIGLMYISAYIKKFLGDKIDVKLINTVIDVDSKEDLSNKINEFKPDVIGVRVLSVNFAFFKEMLAEFPEAIVVAGGPHVNLDPMSVISLDKVNFISIGEGEKTFLELLTNIINGDDCSQIKGLGHKIGGKPKINLPRPFIEDLDSLPFPDYTVINQDKYAHVLNYGYTIRKQAVLLTSRGCPFSCHYCFNFYGRKYRKRSAANVFEELKYLYDNNGIRDFFIVDDTFNVDRQRCFDFFNMIIESGLKVNIYFTSGLRGDLLDEELIDKMIEAGTIWITFGVETVNPRVQKLANRNANVAKLKAAINYCCSKNMMVGAFFMAGFPSETIDEAMETLNFIKEIEGLTMPFMFFVKFFPGTRLYEIAVEAGIEVERDTIFKPYHDVKGHKTDAMSESDFRELFLVYMREIFLNPARLKHALATQRRYLSETEVNAVYETFLKRKINSPEESFNLNAH